MNKTITIWPKSFEELGDCMDNIDKIVDLVNSTDDSHAEYAGAYAVDTVVRASISAAYAIKRVILDDGDTYTDLQIAAHLNFLRDEGAEFDFDDAYEAARAQLWTEQMSKPKFKRKTS